jgi:hypothetical protein
MFQEPRGLPPKKSIQHEILLQKDGPLLNIDMCGMLVMENFEIIKQVQEFLDKGVMKPSTSPCRSPIVLVADKYCIWRMWVDFRALNKSTNMIAEGDIWKKYLKEKKAPLHALTSYVFHLVIRYKKDIYDKVADMLTRPIDSALVIFKNYPIMHESYVEQYDLDADFKDVYATLCCTNQVEELDSYVHGKLLYLGKLCFSQGERVNMIRESYSSLVVGHFGVGNMMVSLQSKNPKFWDDHLHYFQHAYNQTKRSLTQTPPFEACFGYLPKYPLDFIFGKDVAIEGHYDVDRENKFIEKIQLVHQMVQEQLEKSQSKYKTRHDKFHVGLKGKNPSKDRCMEVAKVR